MTTKLLCVTLA